MKEAMRVGELHASGEALDELRDGPVRGAARRDPWPGIGLLIFLLLSAFFFREVLETGVSSSALIAASSTPVGKSDVVFEAWLVARNARTLSRHPRNLFETEHCAPDTQTLTYGIPMITMGLLALPVSLFTPNPALAYNFATLMLWFGSALAMYLLVKDWTGVSSAAVVAGILYAFCPVRFGTNIIHPSVWDSSWLVFALYFSRRLFAHGRWRDVFGLSIACSLQMAASFYPFLAAVLFAPGFVIWLFIRYGVVHLRIEQALFFLLIMVSVASICFGPYVVAQSHGALPSRTLYFFTHWSWLAPGARLFIGWGSVCLAVIGVIAPRRTLADRIGGDPRWIILTSGVLVTMVSSGPFVQILLEKMWPAVPISIPNLYELLASFLPGLDAIRVVARLMVALQVAVCVVAGVGAAWLIRAIPSRETWVAAALTGFAVLSITLGSVELASTKVSADPAEIRFFQELEALGNRGPIVELPLRSGFAEKTNSPNEILLTVYHGRRTYTCFGSYRPKGREQVEQLVKRLPSLAAQKQLRKLGFTTLIVRHGSPAAVNNVMRRLERGLGWAPRIVHESEKMTAYELRS